MIPVHHTQFSHIYEEIRRQLLGAPVIGNRSWQSTDVSEFSQFNTHELRDVIFSFDVSNDREGLIIDVEPDLPWAEDHFEERVSGEPLNPPPSEQWWPHHKGRREDHLTEGKKYSHTYPERLWPKYAGDYPDYGGDPTPWRGIRYPYGDLRDVVDHLTKDPTSRQAYVPIWFPEDTGVVHGERVPCTLGYHFMIRDGKLHCTYLIRSVDFVRHFRNDVYMAGRLQQWVCDQVTGTYSVTTPEAMIAEDARRITPGELTMHTMSMHLFVGDVHRVKGNG